MSHCIASDKIQSYWMQCSATLVAKLLQHDIVNQPLTNNVLKYLFFSGPNRSENSQPRKGTFSVSVYVCAELELVTTEHNLVTQPIQLASTVVSAYSFSLSGASGIDATSSTLTLFILNMQAQLVQMTRIH